MSPDVASYASPGLSSDVVRQLSCTSPRRLLPPKKKELFTLKDALERVKGGAKARFDETIEAHIKLNVRESCP